MKKLAILIILMLICTTAFAVSPDRRLAPYNRILTSQDVIASGNLAIQLSANTSQKSSMIYLCANPANTVAVSWGADNTTNASAGPGVPLVGIRSCDTILIDNLQDVWVSSETGAATVDYTYFR